MAKHRRFSDAEIKAVYGIQGSLRKTGETMGLSCEYVRQRLNTCGVDTTNPDGRGSPSGPVKPTPPPKLCGRCGAEIPYDVCSGPADYAARRFCGVECANARNGNVRARVTDAALLAAVIELRSITAVSAQCGLTNLGVRARLGTILFHWLVEDQGNGPREGANSPRYVAEKTEGAKVPRADGEVCPKCNYHVAAGLCKCSWVHYIVEKITDPGPTGKKEVAGD